MTEPAKPLKVRPKKLTPADEMAMVFARSATRAGCPPDQIFNFCKAGVWLQPKQLEFCAAARQCDLPDGPKAILNGGGRGTGKSHTVLAQIFCDDCQRVPGLKDWSYQKGIKLGWKMTQFLFGS